MIDRGFRPDFEPAVEAELGRLRQAPDPGPAPGRRDLRSLLWSSIDEVESRDLDQIEVIEALAGGDTRVRVAIADVDSLVPAGSAIDGHAAWNTTSVYTGVAIFPMLRDFMAEAAAELRRRGVVVIYGTVRLIDRDTESFLAWAVGAWLEESGPAPPKVGASAPLAAQLRAQDAAAQALRQRRHERGALPLETIEARAEMDGEAVKGLVVKPKNRARQLIEDFMVAANVAMATFLEEHRSPWIGRVVRVPQRWARIVELARQLGDDLPLEPSATALSDFLERQRARDPLRYPDLSLSVVKLLGSGDYVLEKPGQPNEGHFGLAVDDYTHSTAPNRRYADLVTQRLLKAVLAKAGPAYDDGALAAIALRCTEREDEANRVERQVRKQAAAVLLADRVGQRFDALVTGASPKGTWVRVLRPPVEGRVMQGEEGLDVGDKVRVRLIGTDPVHGFIDFARD
ncbi:MAG: ribonuclease II [Acidobacteria bacterium]|nr:MAG: ribonuclease II [Acidobacteriota bacterium]